MFDLKEVSNWRGWESSSFLVFLFSGYYDCFYSVFVCFFRSFLVVKLRERVVLVE